MVTGDPSDTELAALTAAIGDVDGVGAVAPFERADDGVAYTTAALTDAALEESSQDAIREVRDVAVPGDGELLVSGNTARFIDEKSLLANAPPVVLLIVVLTVVLLFLLTGSVLLPLKTLLMNALTLAAVLGVMVLLVPALMRLLGEANWWAPGPLRRLHERFGIKEESQGTGT